MGLGITITVLKIVSHEDGINLGSRYRCMLECPRTFWMFHAPRVCNLELEHLSEVSLFFSVSINFLLPYLANETD